MALDPGGCPRAALDDVRIQRALDQEPRSGIQLSRLLLEHPDEVLADDLPLALRVRHSVQTRQEQVGPIEMDQRDLEVLRERGHDLLGLSGAQQPVVHEHARQVLADGPVHEERRHRGIHAARQRADRVGLADLQADPFDRPLDHVHGRPVGKQAAALVQEPLQDVQAPGSVRDLRVKLHGVESAIGVLHRGHGDPRRSGRDLEPRRRRGHRVRVAHPHHVLLGQIPKQRARRRNRDGRSAVLSDARVLHTSSERLCHGLLAVADPEDGNADLEQARVDLGGARLVDAGRAT